MPTDTKKLPLGGPAWLRAIASDREVMLHALGSIDDETEKEERHEVQGLRDAATRLARYEQLLEEAVRHIEHCHPNWRANQSRPELKEFCAEVRNALES